MVSENGTSWTKEKVMKIADTLHRKSRTHWAELER